MELLERYLQAVKFWLPKTQQDDITEELRDAICSRIEDKESALGRPVNEDELVALLQQAGHPMRVAARYQPQESLIGPALFPLYKFIVKMVAFGYLAPWIVVWAALMMFVPSYRAQHQGIALLGTWTSFWGLAFNLLGMVTLVFAVMERFQARIYWLNKWDPRKLPRKVVRKQRVSRVESIFGLAFSIVFIVWWLALPRYGHMMFGPLAQELSLNPALRAYYLTMLVPTLVITAQQCINLFRPQWTLLRSICMLAADAISLGIIESLMKIHPYVIWAHESAIQANVLFIINQVIQWSVLGVALGILIGLVVHAFQTVQGVRRLIQERRRLSPLQTSQLL